jgi:hypothetical protein
MSAPPKQKQGYESSELNAGEINIAKQVIATTAAKFSVRLNLLQAPPITPRRSSSWRLAS